MISAARRPDCSALNCFPFRRRSWILPRCRISTIAISPFTSLLGSLVSDCSFPFCWEVVHNRRCDLASPSFAIAISA